MANPNVQMAQALTRIADSFERVTSRAIKLIDKVEKIVDRDEERRARYDAEDAKRRETQGGE